jgi:hypothetical protein
MPAIGETDVIVGTPRRQHHQENGQQQDRQQQQRQQEIHGCQHSQGGQNDDFRPLSSTLGGRGMGCRDKYVTS